MLFCAKKMKYSMIIIIASLYTRLLKASCSDKPFNMSSTEKFASLNRLPACSNLVLVQDYLLDSILEWNFLFSFNYSFNGLYFSSRKHFKH